MKRAKPMIGKIFTDLTVLEYTYTDGGHAFYKCVCKCGKFRIAAGAKLRAGFIKHCEDCQKSIRFENSAEYYKKTRHIVGKTRFVWRTILQRCTNPKNKDYKNYGGRGISIEDPRWYVYENFLADMGESPEGLQIDRIDNDKGYSSANCRWTTQKVNVNNRRPEYKSKKVRNHSMNDLVSV